LQVNLLAKRLDENSGTLLAVNGEAQRHLAHRGFDLEFGARPLKRLIQRELEDVLAYKILDNTIQPGDNIEVRLTGEQLSFHRIKPVES